MEDINGFEIYLYMTQQTVKCRLVNFEGLQVQNQQELQCHKNAFNSFMLKVSELEEYDETDKFTQCEKCDMILTDQDRPYLDDWYMVSENRKLYPDKQLNIMEKDPWKYFIWNCRFCANRNLIKKENTFLAKNRSKVILNEGIRPEDQKRYCDDPILLFLIDNSSSMEEEIGELNDEKKITKEISKILNDSIKSTQIYKKITENEEKRLKQINQQFKKQCHPGQQFQVQQFKDHLNKYKVLMALTENSVNEICGSGNKTQENLNLFDNKEPKKRKIGFMFFNSDVILQKHIEKENKIIKVSDRQHFDQIQSSSDQIRVDFQNFDNLYRIGKQNSLGYGVNITNFKFKDIEVRGMDSPQGQTALGPALTIASGIVNNYGPGSSIVVVTDGKANKGIFSSDGVYKKDLQQLKYRLDKAKAELCLIRLGKKQAQDKKQVQSDLQNFFVTHSKIVVIPLDLKDSLDLLKNKLKALVDNSVGGKTYTDDIKIKCQNSNVNYDLSIKQLKKKLFTNEEKAFFHAKISEDRLTHKDYRYPFMTQVLVKYTDVNSRRSSIFMCYMIQKLIKYKQIKKEDQELLQSTQTLSNVLSYINNEGQKIDIDKLPLYMESFRVSIMHSMSMSIDKNRKISQMQFEDQNFFSKIREEERSNFTIKQKLQNQLIRFQDAQDEKL